MKAIENHTATVHRSRHFSDQQIRHMKESATKQEKEIGRWFYNHPDQAIGPGKLHAHCEFPWPITSTRRAITNLTTAGILQKTNHQSMGPYGRPEHHWQWRVPTNEPEQQSLF